MSIATGTEVSNEGTLLGTLNFKSFASEGTVERIPSIGGVNNAYSLRDSGTTMGEEADTKSQSVGRTRRKWCRLGMTEPQHP